jgi:hypothetical protein
VEAFGMSDNPYNEWQFGITVEQARLSYHELSLSYPRAALMVRPGQAHQNSDDAATEAENQEWRTLVKAYAAIISQIWFASMYIQPPPELQSLEPVSLDSHAEKVIAQTVGENWRSLERFVKYLFADWKLEQHVTDLVTQHTGFDAELQQRYAESPDRALDLNSWWDRTFNA